MIIGSFSNYDSNGSENVTIKTNLHFLKHAIRIKLSASDVLDKQ